MAMGRTVGARAGVHGPRGAAAGRPGARGRTPGRGGARGRPGGPHAGRGAAGRGAPQRSRWPSSRPARTWTPGADLPAALTGAHVARARRRRVTVRVAQQAVEGAEARAQRVRGQARDEYRHALEAGAARRWCVKLDALLLEVGTVNTELGVLHQAALVNLGARERMGQPRRRVRPAGERSRRDADGRLGAGVERCGDAKLRPRSDDADWAAVCAPLRQPAFAAPADPPAGAGARSRARRAARWRRAVARGGGAGVLRLRSWPPHGSGCSRRRGRGDGSRRCDRPGHTRAPMIPAVARLSAGPARCDLPFSGPRTAAIKHRDSRPSSSCEHRRRVLTGHARPAAERPHEWWGHPPRCSDAAHALPRGDRPRDRRHPRHQDHGAATTSARS